MAEAEGSGEPRPPLALQAEPPSEDEADPFLEKLLAAAEPAGASVAGLDAAAHALLVRERFEEAEPLVLRALSAAPMDAEASIHQAVLKGVLGNEAAARAIWSASPTDRRAGRRPCLPRDSRSVTGTTRQPCARSNIFGPRPRG